MKNRIKRILTIIAASTVISSTVLASGYTQTIEVMMNSIRIRVNGEYMSGHNISYKGTTYVPLRAVGEILGKDIGWDKKTKTTTIDDKLLDSNEGDFKVPAGVPEGATLVESIPEYKYHKFNYIVGLPSGGRIVQVAISHVPDEDPYIYLVGHDSDNIPFIRYAYDDSYAYDSGPYYLFFNESHRSGKNINGADYGVAFKEIDKFFKAYGYEYSGYDEWLKYN